MKKIFGVLLSAILVTIVLAPVFMSAVSAADQDDMGTGGDAGNTISEAAQFSISKTGTGHVDAGDSADFYQFVALENYLLRVEVVPAGHFTIEVYNIDKNLVAQGTENLTLLSPVINTSGYCYVAVKYLHEGYTDYTLTITQSETQIRNSLSNPLPHNDMGTGADASDEVAFPTKISPGSGTGYLDAQDNLADRYWDDFDYYSVYASSGQTITATITPGTGLDIEIQILDPTSGGGPYEYATSGSSKSVSKTTMSSGYYIIYVSRVSGSGYYSLTVSTGGAVNINDMGTGGDAGDTYSAAALVSPGTGTGYLGESDMIDVYKVAVSSGQLLSVTVVPPSDADFNLTIYDGLVPMASSSKGVGQTDSADVTAALSGYLYIWVTQVSGSGNYTMTVAVSSATSGKTENGGTAPAAATATAVTVDISSHSAGESISVGENGVASITITSATASGATAMTVNFEATKPVKTISVVTTAAATSVSVQAEQLSTKPATIAADPTDVEPGIVVSHYLELSVTPAGATAVSVENATVEFKVEKAWLNSNNIDPATVVLMRYSGGQWSKLPTSASATPEDSTYKYYTANTPGFSTFAVAGKAAVASPSSSTLLIIAGVVILVAIVAVAAVATRFRKP